MSHCPPSPVRRGTLADVPKFVELGMRFYADEGEREACPSSLEAFALSHVCDLDKVYLVAGAPISAVMCGVFATHYFTGEPTAFKTAWYALPEAKGLGAHLLRAFQTWAAGKGARRLIVAGRNDRTLKMLSLLGFHPLETVYTKDLPWQKQHSPSC